MARERERERQGKQKLAVFLTFVQTLLYSVRIQDELETEAVIHSAWYTGRPSLSLSLNSSAFSNTIPSISIEYHEYKLTHTHTQTYFPPFPRKLTLLHHDHYTLLLVVIHTHSHIHKFNISFNPSIQIITILVRAHR